MKKKLATFLQPTQSEEETGDIPATRNRRYSYNEQRVKKKLARFLQRTKSKEETGDIPTTKTESEEETGDTPTTNNQREKDRRPNNRAKVSFHTKFILLRNNNPNIYFAGTRSLRPPYLFPQPQN